MNKILIAYFSASGETGKLAKTLSAVTGGDLFEIRPETAYTSADLNWMDKKSRSTLEMKDEHSRPAIAGRVEDMAPYDTVFVGFPIWWYQAPRIIETFLESYDFTGKTVIPFATSGGSGMGKTADILRTVCPAADILPGKRMSAGERRGRARVGRNVRQVIRPGAPQNIHSIKNLRITRLTGYTEIFYMPLSSFCIGALRQVFTPKTK